MKKIVIILILFQLIGCAKQPVVTTRPEKEQETPQHDTPQAPKTNYLKIGAYIGGIILTILASIGLIAYCCRQKEEEKVPVTDQKEPVTDQKEPVTDQKEPVTDQKEPVTDQKEPVTDQKEPVTDQKEPVTDQKEPVTDQKVQDNRPLAEIRAEIAEERAQQDAQDIDRIVQSVTKEIQNHYPNIKNCILYIYRDDPKYKGNVELQAILKWYFLLPAQNCYEGLPETNLCRQRESAKIDLNGEVADAQEKHPTMPMLELLTNIETDERGFIATTMRSITMYEEAMEDRRMVNRYCHYAVDNIARIVYYYEFKDSLLRDGR